MLLTLACHVRGNSLKTLVFITNWIYLTRVINSLICITAKIAFYMISLCDIFQI